MSEIITALVEELRYHWEWLLAASLKVTAWLLLAGVVLRLLRNSSASVRHAIAVVAAIGVAAIFVLNLSPIPDQSGWRPFAQPAAPLSVEAELTVVHSARSAAPEEGLVAAAAEPEAQSAKQSWAADPLGAIVGLWLVGFAVVAWRLLKRIRKSCPFSSEAPAELVALAESEARRLNLKPKRVPRLVIADEAMPMVVGLRRPIIVLPTEASDWSRQKVNSVIRHELLHVRRRDLWWALIVEVALLPAWWHPLARSLKRRVAELTEQACDDAVIASGSAPAAYASDLLSLSRRLLPVHPSALAIPARSRSESGQVARFRRVLDDSARRHSLSPRWLMAIVALALALVIPGTILISCATTEADELSESAERQASAETEAALATATHPPIDGVPADAEKLTFSIKFFEVDITDDPRFSQPDLVDWIDGKRLLLSPDEGFRLFHPLKPGVDILFAPRVVTFAGEIATIEIGTAIPIEAAGGDANLAAIAFPDESAPTPSQGQEGIDYVKTGISMTVKATPTGDAKVLRAEIAPSLSELLGFVEDEEGNQLPELEVRERVFSGRFRNGSYLCVGVKSDIQSIEDKVPLLGDIPLLGRLFRSEQTRELRRVIAVQVVVEEWK